MLTVLRIAPSHERMCCELLVDKKNKEQLFSMLVDFSFTRKKKGLRKLLIFAKGLHVCMLTGKICL